GVGEGGARTLAVLLVVFSRPRGLAVASLGGALLTGGVLALAGVAFATGFDSAWTQFHVLAFSNDFWALDPSRDHLIQMFPEAFWRDITTLIGAVTMLEALLIAGPATVYLIRSRANDEGRAVAPKPEVAGRDGHARPRIDAPQ